MTATYYVIPTATGLDRIANAHLSGSIRLKKLIMGDANGLPYDPMTHKNRTTLVNQRAEVDILRVTALPNGNIRVIAVIPGEIGGFNFHELGLLDQNNELIYIGNWHGGYKPLLTEGAGGAMNIFIDIRPEHGAPVIIQVLNPTVANQYQLFADAIWHVHSWHGTDSLSYDPATALEPFFGYKTIWRLRPYAPYGLNTLSEAVLHQIDLSAELGNKASTTRIWKRMPDDYQDPTYALTANKSTINEGENVTFSLQTAYLAAGTKIGWQISGITGADITPNAMNGFFTIDQDGRADYTIQAVEDLSTEGNETLRFALLDEPSIFDTVAIQDSSKTPNYSYALSADKTAIDAGDSVTVILTTTEVLNGTQLGYSITGLDESSLSKVAGTFVVQNNQATMSFDVFDVETQRDIADLTIALEGGLASTSIAKNIPVIETIVDLSTALTTLQFLADPVYGNVFIKEPCNLRTVFNDELGRGPNVNEHIRFILPEQFAIVGAPHRTPAITSGAWRSSNEVTIENHGYILGRGGSTPRDMSVRGIGGDAIINTSGITIKIENSHVIAGGGGAGGDGSYSSGTGAPLGKYLHLDGTTVIDIENGGYLSNAATLATFSEGGRGMQSGDTNGLGNVQNQLSGNGGNGGAWGEQGGSGKLSDGATSIGFEAGTALNGLFIIISNTGTIKGRED